MKPAWRGAHVTKPRDRNVHPLNMDTTMGCTVHVTINARGDLNPCWMLDRRTIWAMMPNLPTPQSSHPARKDHP